MGQIYVEAFDKSYFAGLFDGEGSIVLAIRKCKKTRFNKVGLRFMPQVSITLVKDEITDWLLEKICIFYNGTRHERWDGNLNHGEQIIIAFSPRKSISLLDDIKDFLVIKKKQALLILEYDGLINLKKRKIPRENMKRRLEIFNKIKKLNGRWLDTLLDINKIMGECY